MQYRARDDVEKILKDKHKLSGGNCGLTLPKIRDKAEIEIKEVKSILKVLYQENKITLHPGGCGKLFKWKT